MNRTMTPARPSQCKSARLAFIRHGATAPNLAGLRCGGDLDVPMTEIGLRQVDDAARKLVGLNLDIGLIVTSDLRRTRDTAAIISVALGGVEIQVLPDFGERRLGAWNMQSVPATEAQLRDRLTPPGGESDKAFLVRIGQAVNRLAPLLPRRPLLVGSRGVARALGELLGRPGRVSLQNGEVVQFDLANHLQPSVAPCHTECTP